MFQARDICLAYSPRFEAAEHFPSEQKHHASLLQRKVISVICYEPYADFGADGGAFFNSDGSPMTGTRSQDVIKWETIWNKVAFVPPFVFGFSDSFIEVRNVTTGALVQMKRTARNIRCVSNPVEIRD